MSNHLHNFHEEMPIAEAGIEMGSTWQIHLKSQYAPGKRYCVLLRPCKPVEAIVFFRVSHESSLSNQYI